MPFAETGTDGRYSLDVEYGTYTVSVNKDRYIELKASREIEEGFIVAMRDSTQNYKEDTNLKTEY